MICLYSNVTEYFNKCIKQTMLTLFGAPDGVIRATTLSNECLIEHLVSKVTTPSPEIKMAVLLKILQQWDFNNYKSKTNKTRCHIEQSVGRPTGLY